MALPLLNAAQGEDFAKMVREAFLDGTENSHAVADANTLQKHSDRVKEFCQRHTLSDQCLGLLTGMLSRAFSAGALHANDDPFTSEANLKCNQLSGEFFHAVTTKSRDSSAGAADDPLQRIFEAKILKDDPGLASKSSMTGRYISDEVEAKYSGWRECATYLGGALNIPPSTFVSLADGVSLRDIEVRRAVALQAYEQAGKAVAPSNHPN